MGGRCTWVAWSSSAPDRKRVVDSAVGNCLVRRTTALCGDSRGALVQNVRWRRQCPAVGHCRGRSNPNASYGGYFACPAFSPKPMPGGHFMQNGKEAGAGTGRVKWRRMRSISKALLPVLLIAAAGVPVWAHENRSSDGILKDIQELHQGMSVWWIGNA